MRPVDGALYCAEKGWHVFPILPGQKKPYVSNWKEWATVDPQKIEGFAVAQPTANWAIACGEGICVLDVDCKKDNGLESLTALESEHGKIPPTWKQSTPNNGYHFVMYGEIPNSVGKLGPGLDTRGPGGYILAPGSILREEDGIGDIIGTYEIISDVQPCLAPTWMTAAHAKATPSPQLVTDVTGVVQINEGSRNDNLYRMLCSLRARGLGNDAMADMARSLNTHQVHPPLDLDEVQVIWEQACKREPGTARDALAFSAVEAAAPGRTVTDGWKIDLANMKDTPWIVEPFAARGYLTVIASPPGMGKSRIAMLTAIGIASGSEEILGHKVEEPTPCLYISEDPPEDLEQRFVGACQGSGLDHRDVKVSLYSMMHEPMLLISKRNGEFVPCEATIQWLIDTIKEKNAGVCYLDPYSNVHTVEENASQDSSAVCDCIRRIMSETNCAVIMLHHTTKSSAEENDRSKYRGNQNAIRGSGALMGRARFAFTVDSYDAGADGQYAIGPGDAWRWLCMDIAKGNTLPPNRVPRLWYQMAGHVLDCHKEGRSVGIVRKKDPPIASEVEVNPEETNAALMDAIEAAFNAGTSDRRALLPMAREIIRDAEGGSEFIGMEPERLRGRIKRLLRREVVHNDYKYWLNNGINRAPFLTGFGECFE